MTVGARALFAGARAAGWCLREARYSTAEVVTRDDRAFVRKQRRRYAQPLLWLGNPALWLLDAGVIVLPISPWRARERTLYRALYDAEVTIESDGALHLPVLPGVALDRLLRDRALDRGTHATAVALAVDALAEMHRAGFTHGDAMAANVLVELEEPRARWIDFETVHSARLDDVARRADDVRALLMTCALHGTRAAIPELVHSLVLRYGDGAVTARLTRCFATVAHRALPFHLGQAPLSFERYRAIGRALADLR